MPKVGGRRVIFNQYRKKQEVKNKETKQKNIMALEPSFLKKENAIKNARI